MKFHSLLFLIFCIMLVSSLRAATPPRDYVSVVGSSTVYPFATVVAEKLGRSTRFRTPRIAALGSGGGIRVFCAGIGPQHPDIALASRQIKASEVRNCRSNKVNEVTEIKFGYDGIIIATARRGPSLRLTLKDIYLALAKSVPDPRGGEKLVPNPNTSWQHVHAFLPDIPIRVFGPPPTSGTRDVLVELAMARGCSSYGWLAAWRSAEPERFKSACHAIREDGAYIDSGENDNVIIKKIELDARAVGIFGFNFYDQNTDRVQAAEINGVPPTWDTIFEHVYPLSRPLYVYVKEVHIGWIPGLKEFLLELTDERTWGEEGYLSDRGLIPMTKQEREVYLRKVRALK